MELYATCLAADTCLCIPMFMLQRDAIVGHAEAIRTQSRNHQRHTHTRNASLPTQANHYCLLMYSSPSCLFVTHIRTITKVVLSTSAILCCCSCPCSYVCFAPLSIVTTHLSNTLYPHGQSTRQEHAKCRRHGTHKRATASQASPPRET